MLVVMTAAFLTIVMMVVMVMLMMMLKHLVELLLNRVCPLHCIKHLLSSKLCPSGACNSCGFIVLTHKLYRLKKLCFAHLVCVAENNTACVLYLIIEKLTKVLHIHLALTRINNNRMTVKLYLVGLNSSNSLHNVAELSNTRRLDKHSCGVILTNNLAKCIAKVTDK